MFENVRTEYVIIGALVLVVLYLMNKPSMERKEAKAAEIRFVDQVGKQLKPYVVELPVLIPNFLAFLDQYLTMTDPGSGVYKQYSRESPFYQVRDTVKEQINQSLFQIMCFLTERYPDKSSEFENLSNQVEVVVKLAGAR